MPIHYPDDVEFFMCDANGNRFGPLHGIETVSVTPDDSTPMNLTYLSGPLLNQGFTMTCAWRAPRYSRKRFCRELVKMDFTKKEAKAVARKLRGHYGNHLFSIRICGKENIIEKLIKGKK